MLQLLHRCMVLPALAKLLASPLLSLSSLCGCGQAGAHAEMECMHGNARWPAGISSIKSGRHSLPGWEHQLIGSH